MLRPTNTAAIPALNGYGTWVQFIDAFKLAFEHTDVQGDAMAQLMSLHMKKGQLTEYTAEFNMLATRARINDDINKCQHYMTGMEGDFMEKLFGSGQVKLDNYQNLVNLANNFNNDLLRLADFKCRKGNYHSNFQNNCFQNNSYQSCPHYVNSSASKDPNAMDVDKAKFVRLTPEISQKCIKEGLCLYCREKGHMARECPKKTDQPCMISQNPPMLPLKKPKKTRSLHSIWGLPPLDRIFRREDCISNVSASHTCTCNKVCRIKE